MIKMTNEMILIKTQTATAHDALKTTPERQEARAEVCYCLP